MVTIQRKTIEDIIASREKCGGVNGGNVGGIINNTTNSNSDFYEDSKNLIGGVSGGVNEENGGVNSDITLLKHLTVRQNRIKEIIKLKPSVTVQQMVTILSIPKRTLERDLSALQKAKVIRHEGSDKSGIWVVLEPYNTDME